MEGPENNPAPQAESAAKRALSQEHGRLLDHGAFHTETLIKGTQAEDERPHHSLTSMTQIWFAGCWGDGSRRMKAILLPLGENTHASGRGAEASSVREARRVVWPEATSVTQTLLSITWAI